MNFGEELNKIQEPSGFNFAGGNIGDIVSSLLNYAFTFAGIGLLIYFILGGFQLFTSGGDQKKVAEGKSTITNALIGFVIVFVAFWIVQLFGNILGLQPIIGGGAPFR